MFKQHPKVWSAVREYGIITVATLIMVIGIYVFKFPNNFSFGGVSGMAVLLAKLTSISAGNWTFLLNMALLVLGFLFLGKSFGIKTVYVSVLMSVALKRHGKDPADVPPPDHPACAGADLRDLPAGLERSHPL